MQSSDQGDGAEFTALAAEERAENSEVPKFRREPIRTRRSRLSLWCRSKRVCARQNDGTRIITKEDRAQRETTGMFGA